MRNRIFLEFCSHSIPADEVDGHFVAVKGFAFGDVIGFKEFLSETPRVGLLDDE